jgi:hypothetical protein
MYEKVELLHMTVIGAHRVNKGKMDIAVCESIAQMEALVPSIGTYYGAGAYAYYADHIPCDARVDPF